MNQIFSLESLDIIGCKEVPVFRPAMPRLLSPIFAVRGTDKVLFPPYTHGDFDLIRPDVSSRAEFDDLVAGEEVSAYGPIQALPEHELWLDDMGNFQYDLDYRARERLISIFEARSKLAHLALKSGSLAEARTHAMIAYSANPRSLNPLIYRAAAEHLLISKHYHPDKTREELALTEILAESQLSIPEFKILYLELTRACSVGTGRNVTAIPKIENRGKLAGIASRKPSKPSIQFLELACKL